MCNSSQGLTLSMAVNKERIVNMDPLQWLTDNWVNILAALGAINLAAQTVARLTPTDADDVWVLRFKAFLEKLGSLGLSPAPAKEAALAINVDKAAVDKHLEEKK